MNGLRMSNFGSSSLASEEAIKNRAPARLLGQPMTYSNFCRSVESAMNDSRKCAVARCAAASRSLEQSWVVMVQFGRVVVRPKDFDTRAFRRVIGLWAAKRLAPFRGGIESVHQRALVIGERHHALHVIENF